MKKVTIQQVLNSLDPHINKEGKKTISKAYNYAKEQHKNQKRKTGEEYVQHPLNVALEIAKLHIDYVSIAAAILHDVLEDCNVCEDDLKKEFGEEITEIVKGVTKLRHTKDIPSRQFNVNDLRRLFFAATKDIRVLIIKLADRLHNARTIQGLKPERQFSYAQEILNIYSPLAEFIGIYYFKRDLEDAAFKTINPKEYKRIEGFLKKSRPERLRYIKSVTQDLNKEMRKNRVKCKILGRDKSIYGIYRKLRRYLSEGKIKTTSEFQKIYDYFGFRILVNNKIDCYKVLGIIHSLWHPILNEFDDYIANPKPNGYKSLHTTVFCKENHHAEFQIRTYKMHEFSEFGPASHIAYKMAGSKYAKPVFGFNWLKSLFTWQKKEPSKLTSDDFRIDVFKDNIFVLTPTNEVKELPKGSTPVDFAYQIHSQIGNSCRGAKINGKLVPLSTELNTGDIVEILTEKRAKYPIEDWLDFLKVASTRSKIKHALREKNRLDAFSNGEQLLAEELKKNNISIEEFNKVDLIKIFDRYNIKSKHSLITHIGYEMISSKSIVEILFPKERQKKIKYFGIPKKSLVEIEGSIDSEFTIAKCCSPAKDDDIIAVSTITRGLRIHKKACKIIENFDKERLLRAKWIKE